MNYIDENKITKEDILSEETLQWLITTPLYNIGEHAYALSNEYKESHKGINWTMIAGPDIDWFMITMELIGIL